MNAVRYRLLLLLMVAAVCFSNQVFAQCSAITPATCPSPIYDSPTVGGTLSVNIEAGIGVAPITFTSPIDVTAAAGITTSAINNGSSPLVVSSPLSVTASAGITSPAINNGSSPLVVSSPLSVTASAGITSPAINNGSSPLVVGSPLTISFEAALNSTAALAANATTGFVELPHTTAVPTGVPAGPQACAVNTTSGFLNCYWSGTWHSVQFTSGAN